MLCALYRAFLDFSDSTGSLPKEYRTEEKIRSEYSLYVAITLDAHSSETSQTAEITLASRTALYRLKKAGGHSSSPAKSFASSS